MKSLNYKCVNYSKWDFSGKGKNLFSLFNLSERTLWDSVLSLQDKREDIGHAEFVTYFTFKLLESIPADRGIVIPSAILHDTGYNVSPKAFREACASGRDREMRLEHQVIGALTAYEILNQLEYPQGDITEIMKIILNHDTRISKHREINFNFSLDEKLVRDADILWRFTKPCMNQYHPNEPLEKILESMKKEFAKKNLYFEISKEIAAMEIVNTLK